MVKLVEIEDNSDYDSDSQYTTDDESVVSGKEEYSDDEFDSDYDEDDDALDESLLERIAALKDIVPANQRRAISNTVNTISSWGGFGLGIAGKLAWVFTTSALLVVFPLAMESDRDKMMEQWASGQEQGDMPANSQMMMPPGPAPGHAQMQGQAPGLA
ncbi:mitochondrial import receptor subunit Tom22 [Coemansia spiralis]|uniref:Mitochondrial import receptor subunit Tom22 n=2 Tax=Coemansia TaxID=4863 RepID=A0A9W8KVZ0_9FUNG|nr:mitochondrial import receptor subunit Tom22-domain-containing protein [Coemansia spiralis]KAJ1994624.1 mitochondrial import receptor subunit Tom22 [Coemansia umbellata]KAJ2624429.1 mitochondrial import receptor subunit Tom22 [Coemansia sp. RSA 1358]KAJ2671101.1 mitochondrial import receptor subunit Tom22 [Coemansia spiralis]